MNFFITLCKYKSMIKIDGMIHDITICGWKDLLSILYSIQDLKMVIREEIIPRIIPVPSDLFGINLKIPARGVPLIVIKFPAPLEHISTRFTISWDLEATTTWSMISITFDWVTILIWKLRNGHLHQLGLAWIFGSDSWRHIDEDTTIFFIFNSVILSWPSNTHGTTSLHLSHRTPVTTIRFRDRILTRFISTWFTTMFTIRARSEILGVLLIVTVGIIRIEITKLSLWFVWELASITKAFSVLVGPTYYSLL